jgi:DNA mismatch repair protein MutS2
MRIIEIENSKRKKSYHQGVKGIIEKKKVIQEVTVQVEEIRKERKEKKLKLLLKTNSLLVTVYV